MGGAPHFSRLAKLDQRRVGAQLEGRGSRDRDILYADLMSLVASLRRPGRVGATLILAGLLASVTAVGWQVGVALLAGGVWLRRRSNANIAVAERAYAEYLESIQPATSAHGTGARPLA